MAGQGWREWVAGEQLTDEKMQNFLMDQAVMRFANASARDTALSEVLSEGMVAYLDDINTVEVYDGSEWTELTGDPDIFTQGTAGQYLQSNGTAGVEWAAIDGATTTAEGLIYGFTAGTSLARFNVALGFEALPSTTALPTFIGNVAVGVGTLKSMTTGHNNVGYGSQTGLSLTTGSKNTLLGSNSGSSLTTNEDNTFVGFGAGGFVTSSGNTVVGSQALPVATGQVNTAVGWLSLSQVSTGFGNVGIGPAAGASVTTGIHNTCLGPDAGSTFSGVALGSGENNVLIGFNAAPSTANVSNQITLGNSSITSLRCQVTTISALSDSRDKTNVEELPYGVEFVKELKPVSFDWDMRDKARVGDKDFGFIAQDLAALEDKFDAERLALTLRDNPDRLEATPGRLIPILVKAIQELTARVEELENAR
jgi:hypothetical protein